MAMNTPTPTAKSRAIAEQLGVRLRAARLRQRTSQADLARTASVSIGTLRKLENGSTAVGLAAFMSVLEALGVEGDMANVAAADPIGRSMLDETIKGLPRGRRESFAYS
ncbi:MAG: helix-turn-helix domain-containing protein [Pseudomonas sp.]